MRTKIQPLWEVKEIYQGKQVLSYGFHVATEQEARALYERSHRAYPNSTLEADRVDGILIKNARYLSWLRWRAYLNWMVTLLGLLGAGLSVFSSIKLDIQIAGVPLNVFAIVALIALIYTSFVGLYHGPDQQEVVRVMALPIHHGRLSAPPIQRSESK
jgi:hypothetical protein